MISRSQAERVGFYATLRLKLGAGFRVARNEPAYETDGGTVRFLLWNGGGSRYCAALSWSSATRHHLIGLTSVKFAGPEGLAPSRSDLETNPSAWTSRACGARGRYRAGSVCLEGSRASINTSRANWWSWTVTLRLVRVAGAACCYYHHSPVESGRACRNCTDVGQFCGLPDDSSPNARKPPPAVPGRSAQEDFSCVRPR